MSVKVLPSLALSLAGWIKFLGTSAHKLAKHAVFLISLMAFIVKPVLLIVVDVKYPDAVETIERVEFSD